MGRKTIKSRTNNNKNNSSKKSKMNGAGLWQTIASDNVLVHINLPTNGNDSLIKCSICGHEKFQERKATVGKSKTANFLTNTFLGVNSSDTIEDISIVCYFCNNCGDAIIVRDPKAKHEDNYKNIIVSKKI
jgi:hypothetical protein